MHKKLTLAVIGTSFIVPMFIDAADRKVCGTTNSSEIQGEEGTIVIDNISTFASIMFVDKAGVKTKISAQQDSNSLLYIAQHLGQSIASGLKESPVNTHKLSLSVMAILDDVRLQTGVIFSADDE